MQTSTRNLNHLISGRAQNRGIPNRMIADDKFWEGCMYLCLFSSFASIAVVLLTYARKHPLHLSLSLVGGDRTLGAIFSPRGSRCKHLASHICLSNYTQFLDAYFLAHTFDIRSCLFLCFFKLHFSLANAITIREG